MVETCEKFLLDSKGSSKKIPSNITTRRLSLLTIYMEEK